MSPQMAVVYVYLNQLEIKIIICKGTLMEQFKYVRYMHVPIINELPRCYIHEHFVHI
jgi:hypothetical protein